MRFTLWAMFLAVTGLAVYLGMAFATHPIVSIIGLTVVTYTLAPVVITGIVYDRGYGRTFWIGCASTGAFPYVIAVYFGFSAAISLGSGWNQIDPATGRLLTATVAVCHGLVLLSGFAAVGTRWLIEKKNGSTESSASGNRTILSRRIAVEMESRE